jgi:hypothetical protein
LRLANAPAKVLPLSVERGDIVSSHAGVIVGLPLYAEGGAAGENFAAGRPD